MDAYEFMVFSIDEPIECIQQFEQSLMFISTPKGIMLYDFCQSKAITQCQHQSREIQNINNNDQKQGDQNKESQLSAIEIHYFPANQQDENKINSLKQQQNNYPLGHLLVHYKMKGISIYTLSHRLPNNQKQHNSNNIKTTNNQFQLQFSNFTPLMFGSAFLKLSFDDIVLKRVKTPQQIQSNINTFQSLKTKDMDNTQIQRRLKDMVSFQDFEFQSKYRKSKIFYVFTNENELYEVKKLKIQDGQLQLLQSYQIDEQTAQLSLSTVTQMKVITSIYDGDSQSNKRVQKELILAMQGGNLYFYSLPLSIKGNKSSQHYLQPISTLYLQQQIKSRISKDQGLDYSILCIEVISDGLGLVVVRKLGIWLVDLKNYQIITQVQPQPNKQSINTKSNRQSITEKNQQNSNTNKCSFNDVRMVKLINSHIVENSRQINYPNQKQTINTNQKQTINPNAQIDTPLKKQYKISSSFILYTSSKLIKLNLTLQVTKQYNSNDTYQKSVSIYSFKHSIIQDINTNMIQSLYLAGNLSKQQQNQNFNHIDKSNTNKIKLYGHFKEDKIFISTL